MKKWTVSLVTTIVIALAVLLLLSVLTYIFKWQADVVQIGIIITYIVTGCFGGKVLKRFSAREGLVSNILEACCFGILFMTLMFCAAYCYTGEVPVISENGVIIWMLIAGSAALGRIL